MQLSKSFFCKRNPKKIRVFTSGEERYRLAIFFSNRGDTIINDNIVKKPIFVKSEHIYTVLAIFVKTYMLAKKLVK